LTATLFLTVVTCILACVSYQSYTIWYKLGAWEIGTEFLNLVFPLFVTVPVCWQLYYERRDHFLFYTLSRASKKRYLITKWVACALSSFLILTVPYLVSALCDLYAMGPENLQPSPFPASLQPNTHIFYNFLIDMPLLYALLNSLWKGLLGILIMSLGFVLALYSKNLFVILTGPFVYSVLENFGWAILGMPQYRLVTAFEPSCLSTAVVTGASFIVGPLLVCAVIAATVLYYAKVKPRTVYGM